MSYETRRMAAKMAAHQRGEPLASTQLQRALDARAPLASSLVRQPPAAREVSRPQPETRNAPAEAVATTDKPWVQDFFRAAADSDLPLATLNAIVAVCDTYGEAMTKVAARMPGDTPAAPMVAKNDPAAASRIIAAHAKAHQPLRLT